MREKFISKNFRQSALDVITQSNYIIEEYQAQGLTLTLRQLYYRFVGHGWIPNEIPEYKRLVSIINHARLAGCVDWDAIEDRTRYLRSTSTWGSPAEILDQCAHSFRLDRWSYQPRRIEVWIEKDALIGVIEGICQEYQVPYFSCRGNSSQSAVYEAGKRFQDYIFNDQTPLILHLGDHDPSGLDMTRDNSRRINLFTTLPIEVNRLALNMDQVEQYNLPENPVKPSDSKSPKYIEVYGPSCWELDAMEPTVIRDLIEKKIRSLVDFDIWDETLAREKEMRDELKQISKKFREAE